MGHYLHHVIFDPLSYAEQAQANLLLIAALAPVLLVVVALWSWFWDKYNE